MADRQQLRQYRTYLLSVWRDPDQADGPAWRFRLEDPRNGQQRGFNSPTELLALLEDWADDAETEEME